MSKEIVALFQGLIVGAAIIGFGGLLIGSSPVPGAIIVAIAIVGLGVLRYVRGAKK